MEVRKAGLLDGILPDVWDMEWNVHCKATGNGEHVLKYLGAYVFRVVLSDARITRYDGKTVTIKYQKVGSSRWRHMTFTAIEFMRRYLQHVIQKGPTLWLPGSQLRRIHPAHSRADLHAL